MLVVVLGEFGRTPRIAQPGPGREHWADAGCAVLFGGGLRMGQVIGETDSRANALAAVISRSRTFWRPCIKSSASTCGRSCRTTTGGRSICSTTGSPFRNCWPEKWLVEEAKALAPTRGDVDWAGRRCWCIIQVGHFFPGLPRNELRGCEELGEPGASATGDPSTTPVADAPGSPQSGYFHNL